MAIEHLGRVYNHSMSKPVIHISEEEAGSDFASLMARVRAGAEVIIEDRFRPVAVLSPVTSAGSRLLSASIALADAHGCTATLDGAFAHDLEEIVKSHAEPLRPPAWD